MSLPERQSELVTTHRAIRDAELPHVLVGGWAVSAFQTRFTTDIDAVIPETSLDDYEELLRDRGYEKEFEADVSSWGDLTARQAAVHDRSVSLDVVAVTNGTQLAQTNESRALTNDSGAPNWELVEDSDGLRAFNLTLDESSLAVPSNDSSGDELRSEGVFGVDVTYVVQGDPLGIAHAVGCCRDFVGDEDCVVYLGDNILKQGIEALVDSFEADDHAAGIALQHVEDTVLRRPHSLITGSRGTRPPRSSWKPRYAHSLHH
jgi:hypothetical protein